MKKLLVVCLTFAFLLYIGCGREDIRKPISKGGTPGVPNPLGYTSIAGGAIIKFEVPSEADALYVVAKYKDGTGRDAESTVSVYTDTISVRGFSDTSPKDITLFTVNRAGKVSQGVQTTVTSLEPPYKVVEKSLRIKPSVGSAYYAWENPSGSEVMIDMISDTTKLRKGTEVMHTVYTKAKKSFYRLPVNIFDESVFAAVVRDVYGNKSDLVYSKNAEGQDVQKIKPLPEHMVPLENCRVVSLKGDAKWTANRGQPQYLFDDNRATVVSADPGQVSFKNYDGSTGSKPYYLTIKLKDKISLSRITIFERNNTIFRAMPNKFKVYALEDLPSLPEDAPENGDIQRWTLLGSFEMKSVSGANARMGTLTDEDKALYKKGLDIIFAPDVLDKLLSQKVQYLRFAFEDNFISSGFLDLGEAKIYAAGTTPNI